MHNHRGRFVLRHSAAVLCLLLHLNGYVTDRISPFLSPAAWMQRAHHPNTVLVFLSSCSSPPSSTAAPALSEKHFFINASSFLIIDKGPIHRFFFLLPLSALFALCKSHNNGDDTAKLFMLVTISAVSKSVWATGSDTQFMSSLLDMQSFYSLSHE